MGYINKLIYELEKPDNIGNKDIFIKSICTGIFITKYNFKIFINNNYL